MLKALNKQGFKNIRYFSEGKRSIVYIAEYKNKKIAIKTKKPKSEAKGRIQNEANFLKILNKHKIGPKLVLYDKNFLAYEFIKGIKFIDWLTHKNIKEKRKIITIILKKCRILDKLKINKKEFTRPIKHILVYRNYPYFIDFERCYFTENPKNVTQLCQFLIERKLIKNNKQILIKYKKQQTDQNFIKILKLIR